MKKKKSVFFNGIWFFIVFGLTIWGVLHGEDLGELKEYILECDKVWLIPAFICVLLYIWGESIILYKMFDEYQIKTQKAICFLFSSVGFFFSCITPSASGGQPMQLYYMKKDKIPVPVASVILLIVTITYKAVLVVLGIGAFLFAHDFLNQYFGDVLPIFYLGIVLNVICVTAMMMMLSHPTLVRSMLLWIVRVGSKIHLIKKADARYQKIEKSIVSYRETAKFMVSHIRLMTKVFFITVAQRISLFAVPCFVYKAFRLSGISFLTVLILQGLVAVSVDMLPLPGGMGISETLFLIVFEPIFGELVLPGMVLSRGIGYYSMLLISAAFTLVAVVVFSGRKLENEE